MIALFIDGPLVGKTATIIFGAKINSYVHAGENPAVYRAYHGMLGAEDVVVYSAEEPAPMEMAPPTINAALRDHFDAPGLLSVLARRCPTDLVIG